MSINSQVTLSPRHNGTKANLFKRTQIQNNNTPQIQNEQPQPEQMKEAHTQTIFGFKEPEEKDLEIARLQNLLKSSNQELGHYREKCQTLVQQSFKTELDL